MRFMYSFPICTEVSPNTHQGMVHEGFSHAYRYAEGVITPHCIQIMRRASTLTSLINIGDISVQGLSNAFLAIAFYLSKAIAKIHFFFILTKKKHFIAKINCCNTHFKASKTGNISITKQ